MSVIGSVLNRRTLARWARAARRAETLNIEPLRQERGQARALRARLDEFIATADSRLALPRIGSNTFPRPPGSDWIWRPDIWRKPITPRGMASVPNNTDIGGRTTVFHDCRVSELTARQLRNQREADLAPFGLRLDVFRFDGSFLSLALDLPPEASQGLQKRHLIRLNMTVELEKPLEIFSRLNVKHGPNVEQIVREMPLHEEEVYVEFDLAYTKLNEKQMDRMWLDLIFEGPEMNQITLRDLTFARYPRAEL